jgi:hypothetical protein
MQMGLRYKVGKKGGGKNRIMKYQINNIIPTLMGEIESDRENQSKELLNYYMECNQVEKAVVNNVMIYLCGWSFETLLEKCGIGIDENGKPKLAE